MKISRLVPEEENKKTVTIFINTTASIITSFTWGES